MEELIVFLCVFGCFGIFAVSVICYFAFLVVKEARDGTRQRADLQWDVNFAQVQLRHLELLQNLHLVPVGEELEDEGVYSGEE